MSVLGVALAAHLRALDLFSGCGALSLGLKASGIDPLWANDSDPDAAKTFRENHPGTQFFQLDARDLLNAVSDSKDGFPRRGDIEVITGGPPCQGFCQINRHRSIDDPRNSLVELFFDFVDVLRPRAVLMENVTGILTLGKGHAISSLLDALADIGYNARLAILQCGAYGIPQHRWRVFVLAVQGSSAPEFPIPSHAFHRTSFVGMGAWRQHVVYPPQAEWSLFDRPSPATTVGDAIGDLPGIAATKLDEPVKYSKGPQSRLAALLRDSKDDMVWDHVTSKPTALTLRRFRIIPPGGGWQDLPPNLQPRNLQRYNAASFDCRYGRLRWDEPFTAIVTKPEPYWGRFIHPSEDRLVTVRECARAQTFPDSYCFTGGLMSRFRQVGNAVPPLLARLLGFEIRKALGDISVNKEIESYRESITA